MLPNNNQMLLYIHICETQTLRKELVKRISSFQIPKDSQSRNKIVYKGWVNKNRTNSFCYSAQVNGITKYTLIPPKRPYSQLSKLVLQFHIAQRIQKWHKETKNMFFEKNTNFITKKRKKLQNLYFLKKYISMFPNVISMSFELNEIVIPILKAINMAFLVV